MSLVLRELRVPPRPSWRGKVHGCDDICIFVHCWRQSTNAMGIPADAYQERLRYALHRARTSVLTTSITTAGSFFGNATRSTLPMLLGQLLVALHGNRR